MDRGLKAATACFYGMLGTHCACAGRGALGKALLSLLGLRLRHTGVRLGSALLSPLLESSSLPWEHTV